MGQALYRKYRPRSFAEAVGQEAITKTLDEALKSGRVSHAYLFAGPRGVGKTSIARILAHRVNQLPYNQESIHLDIIEIDAASNRRIDEIRDLREKVHITPASAKYKVYIIDEVHMLTKEAFNALLKTLEEPPAHCIFILATTEAHKLPETIISRTQRFNFKPISKNAAKNRLLKIAKEEKIKIDETALDLLAEYGEGSLRDIIGLLDQLGTSGRQISEKEIRSLLGIPSQKAIDDLLGSISNGDLQASLAILDDFKDQANSPSSVAKTLSKRLRQNLLEQAVSGGWLTALLKDLLNVSASPNPQETLELAILEAATTNQKTDGNKPIPPKLSDNQSYARPKQPALRPKKTQSSTSRAKFSLDRWSELLDKVRAEAPSLYTALRLAEPTLNDDRLSLAFPFPLHQKKVQEARHIKLIALAIEEMTGDRLTIKCTVDKELAKKHNTPQAVLPDPLPELKAISNIFGSAEVLES